MIYGGFMHSNEDVGFLMKSINEQIERLANNKLRESGLTLSQIRVLQFLVERERLALTTSQKDVEQYLGVTHPTVIGIVRRLEKKGFIRTGNDSKDGRLKNLYTIPPEDLSEEGFFNPAEMEAMMTVGLSSEQLETLRICLKTIHRNILNYRESND